MAKLDTRVALVCILDERMGAPATARCSATSLSPCRRAFPIATYGKGQSDFASENNCKQAVYAVRWIGTTGAAGPWGEEVRAVVAA